MTKKSVEHKRCQMGFMDIFNSAVLALLMFIVIVVLCSFIQRLAGPSDPSCLRKTTVYAYGQVKVSYEKIDSYKQCLEDISRTSAKIDLSLIHI
jgi:hypothetical protein